MAMSCLHFILHALDGAVDEDEEKGVVVVRVGLLGPSGWELSLARSGFCGLAFEAPLFGIHYTHTHIHI